MFVCIYAHEFPAQALLRSRPDLFTSPVVVMEGNPPLERVCSCNRHATKTGIARGASRVEAETYGVTVLQRSTDDESAAIAKLLEIAHTFSPRIEMLDAGRTFCCVLDMWGMQCLGTISDLTSDLHGAIRAERFIVSVVASHEFHTAVAIARCRKGVRIVPQGKERDDLSRLPLSAIELNPEQTEVFALWGIQTLGELAQLPKADLVSRIGQDAIRLWQLANAQCPHLLMPIAEDAEHREQVHLDDPVENSESLLFVLSTLLERVLVQVSGRALAIGSMTIEYGQEGNSSHARTVRPALPSLDKAFLLKLAHLDLLAQPPSRGVVSVTLNVEAAKPRCVQTGIFAPQSPESSRLDVLLSRLTALVGRENVCSPALKNTYRTDCRTYAPFHFSHKHSARFVNEERRLAVRRLRPPADVRVHLVSSRPCSVTFQTNEYAVRELYGPWRKSGDWWAWDEWRIDEWDVIAQSGNDRLCFVLVHDRIAQRWRVEAIYD